MRTSVHKVENPSFESRDVVLIVLLVLQTLT